MRALNGRLITRSVDGYFDLRRNLVGDLPVATVVRRWGLQQSAHVLANVATGYSDLRLDLDRLEQSQQRRVDDVAQSVAACLDGAWPQKAQETQKQEFGPILVIVAFTFRVNR